MTARKALQSTSSSGSVLTRLLVGGTVFMLGCGGDGSPGATGPPEEPSGDGLGLCSIPEELIFSGGVGRDGIPALSDPILVEATHPDAAYLTSADRVIGIEVDGAYIAIPHKILWWHEIVNLNALGPLLSASYCLLTGSSMVFDRTSVAGAEFGVSGLLFNNNLIMYDRAPSGETSLWPQMMRGARCGPRDGQTLAMYPSVDMEWGGWRDLHRDTRVISASATGFERDYDLYPYGDYEGVNNDRTLYPHGTMDPRRPPKERVLGVPFTNGGGIAFPFRDLDEGVARVVHAVADGEPFVVFWTPSGQTALAFWTSIDGQPLTFELREGRYVDVESESDWGLDGVAISGAMEGKRLQQVPEAYVSFWFAWSTFTNDTELWAP